MHGNHSLLNLDLARQRHEELIASAARHQAIAQGSRQLSRSRLSDLRHRAGSSLIAIGERLRPVERDLLAEEIWADSVSLKLAR